MFIPQLPGSTTEAVVTAAYLVGMGVQYACDLLLIKKAQKMPAREGSASDYRTWFVGLLAYATGVVVLAVCLVTLCYTARVAHYHNFAVATWVVAAQQLIGFVITAWFVWKGLRRNNKLGVS